MGFGLSFPAAPAAAGIIAGGYAVLMAWAHHHELNRCDIRWAGLADWATEGDRLVAA